MKTITILALHLGTGGAEQFISGLANILSENNEVEIISTYKLNDKPAFYIDPKVKITYLMENMKPNREALTEAIKNHNILKCIKEGLYSLRVLYLRRKLMIKAIRRCGSSVIISTRIMHNKWLGTYGRRDSIKIAQEHNHHKNNVKIINKTIKSLRNIDYFMPTSKELTDFYSKALSDIDIKCVYLPHWIDYFPKASDVSNLQNNEIVAVGRLSKEKGFLDLIDVFNLIHNIDDKLKLNLVGDGPERGEIEKRIIQYGLQDSVVLHGFLDRQKLSEVYKKSSLYVMTSFTESYGLVLLEAESFGLPLIAFDSAQGAHEIIENNVNGFLIKNRSKELMAKKIIDLMRNDELKQRLGENARKMAEKHKIENVSIEWNKFFNKICEEYEN